MKISGLRLFHNHMTIEPVVEIFGRYDGKTIAEMRDLIFNNFAASENYGMIFTLMMDFDMPSEWEYLEHINLQNQKTSRHRRVLCLIEPSIYPKKKYIIWETVKNGF